MNLDIHSAIQTAFILLLVALVLVIWIGVRSIRAGNKLFYYNKRKQLITRGWKFIFSALILGLLAAVVRQFGEPIIYRYFPPTATVTITPTITLSPTVTLSPTITLTPTITETPSSRRHQHCLNKSLQNSKSSVTPSPKLLFSYLQFSTKLDKNLQAVNPTTTFKNPITHVYATFSYVNMTQGVQWTAVWYYNSKVICYETKPWEEPYSGGYGYTDCEMPASSWQPGTYEVQIYIGTKWMQTGQFTVTGAAPTAVPTKTNTPTITPSRTPTQTRTATSTRTITPTRTATRTASPANTQKLTATQ